MGELHEHDAGRVPWTDGELRRCRADAAVSGVRRLADRGRPCPQVGGRAGRASAGDPSASRGFVRKGARAPKVPAHPGCASPIAASISERGALREAVDEPAGYVLTTSRIVYLHDPSVIDSAGDGYFRSGGAFKRFHGAAAHLAGDSGGAGEIRSGLLEKSNVDLRGQVGYLQQAKLQLDVTAKLISTNKNLLEESLRLIQ